MAGFRQDPIQLINLIADNLRDRYPDSFSILKELLQNADDAGAKEVHIGLSAGLPRTKHPLLQGPALFLLNDGPFSRRNYEAIQSFGDWSSCFTDCGAGEALEGMRREAVRRCLCDDSR